MDMNGLGWELFKPRSTRVRVCSNPLQLALVRAARRPHANYSLSRTPPSCTILYIHFPNLIIDVQVSGSKLRRFGRISADGTGRSS